MTMRDHNVGLRCANPTYDELFDPKYCRSTCRLLSNFQFSIERDPHLSNLFGPEGEFALPLLMNLIQGPRQGLESDVVELLSVTKVVGSGFTRFKSERRCPVARPKLVARSSR